MLYINGTIITMNAKREIIRDGAILVQGNRFVKVGKTKALREEYPEESTYDLENRAVIPGLIDTHVHLAQALLRGSGDDVELIQWLCETVWVLQGQMTHEESYASARLCIAEMLKSGTTCFLEAMLADRYGFDGIAKAVTESGIRGCIGKIVMDVGKYASQSAWSMHPGLVETREQSLLGALDMHKKWHGKANDRLHVWFGARTPPGVSVELLKEMTQFSRERNIRITMHCAEVKADQDHYRQNHDMTPSEFCDHVGLLGDQTVLVHMVWLDDRDFKLLAKTGTHVSHCPASNSKLASGVSPVPAMLDAGVNVSLGCDGGPSNNCYDLIQEMKLAALIHKAVSCDPVTMSAETVLEMATINGARAVGLEKEIGSIEEGKKADFVVLDFESGLGTTPNPNPVSTLVYAATGGSVYTVVIDGELVVEKRKLLTMDEEEILREARKNADTLYARAGVKGQPKWPVV
ncbi:amidohydrolase [Radiomyces spectabilis]|uniref:amidohydrolase n=1 Tax=Radiomyces spectabilis TaxID=64574 RepID=UPI00221EE97A|nr:amidohydrolase [Radiomyces spectabilis]KAI8388139.1 amidohydrolase [Radiomyces spectabilis]